MKKTMVYPYIPNSVESIKKDMLKDIGVESVEDLLKIIPDSLRFKDKMHLPSPLYSEYDLKKHIEKIMNQNDSCDELISFLGGGCYDHYVPAICDEIQNRAEFLTAYCGDTYTDHGKMQAIFEYCSLMAELVDLDVVSYTLYDGAQAAASSIRMAGRITGKDEILVPKTMNKEILSQMKDYCKGVLTIKEVAYDSKTGRLDVENLEEKMTNHTAAVFYEYNSFLGFVEEGAQHIADLAHKKGALVVAYVDPSCLGVLESPSHLGADILCGDIQPLGIHMQYGGGCAGFIATKDDEKYIREYPTYLYGIIKNKYGEFGWGRALNSRTSHGSREKAKEYFGTETGLFAITAGVYLSLMGPTGMKELGENILYRCNFAKQTLNTLKGVQTDLWHHTSFKEFIVTFKDEKKNVDWINKKLLDYGILGGYDLSKDFKYLGNSALYCITETTSLEDVYKLKEALEDILKGSEEYE